MFKYINFTIDVKSYADLLKAYQAERALLAMKGDVIRTVSEGKIRFTTKERDSFLYLMKVEGYAIGINSVSFEERNGTQVCLTRTVWYTYRQNKALQECSKWNIPAREKSILQSRGKENKPCSTNSPNY